MKKIIGKKRYKLLISFLILVVACTMILYKINNDLKPIMMALCDAQARIIASETINSTIKDEFGNKISYDDIMTIKTDKDGNIVMIQANTVELNRIGSQIAIGIQDRIAGIGGRGVKIPLGILFKNDLLAYYGPKVTFKMQPMGSTLATYRSDFKSAGINQTRQIIYLDVTANVQVIIPLSRNSISITSSIPIAESIIVGKVPNTFVDLNGNIPDGSGLTNYGISNKK
jgi:sporulation protein YunB